MSFSATVYRVLIASPSDLEEERRIIERAIHSWNASFAHADGIVLLPVRWETHSVPEYGDRPQAIVNRTVQECDILIGAFWTRLGSATGTHASGTVEEIEQFTGTGKPVLLYFSSRPIPPDELDPEQMMQVRAFRARVQKQALVHTFSSPAELEMKVPLHLHEYTRRLSAAARRDAPRSAASSTVAAAPGEAPPTERTDASGRYAEYWDAFKELLRQSGSRLRPPTVREKNWIRFPLGSGSVRIYAFASVRERYLGVELALDRPARRLLYECLRQRSPQVEAALGDDLTWDEHEGSYRIVKRREGFDPADRSLWPQQHEWLRQQVEAFDETFSRLIPLCSS